MASELFADLVAERNHLAFAKRSRDCTIQRLEAVDPAGAADEITKECIEVTVADALGISAGPEQATSSGASTSGTSVAATSRTTSTTRSSSMWQDPIAHLARRGGGDVG